MMSASQPKDVPVETVGGTSAVIEGKGGSWFSRLTAHRRIKILITIVCVALVSTAAVVLFAAVDGMPSSGGLCKNISESARTGKNLEVAADPILYNICGLKHCTYDIHSCSTECPLGYITDDKECPVSCECKKNGIFNGDIQFSSDDIPVMLKMISSNSEEAPTGFSLDANSADHINAANWGYSDNAIVPISFDSSFDNATQEVIMTILSAIEQKTCVKFVKRENEPDYVHIYAGDMCSAQVGRKAGENVIVLNKDYCVGTPAVQHAFMHILGFYHEQQRADRDDYVNIHWNNVMSGQKSKFDKMNERHWLNYGVEYNGRSLLHFPYNALAIDDTKPTISGKGDMKIRGEDPNDLFLGLQDTDFLKINTLYRCPGYEEQYETSHWGQWLSWTSSPDIYPRCIRQRSCFRGEESEGVSGVCLNRESESSKLEVVIIHNCDQAANMSKSSARSVRSAKKVKRRSSTMFTDNPTKLDSRICVNGQLLPGNFNQDKLTDLLCYYGDGFIRIYLSSLSGLYKRISWEGPTEFCKYDEKAERIPADLNGDGFTDLVCHRSDGTIETILLKRGTFEESNLEWKGTIPSCMGDGARIHVKDVNGDGRDDLLCGTRGEIELKEVFINQYKKE